jgi:hypothetical protein
MENRLFNDINDLRRPFLFPQWFIVVGYNILWVGGRLLLLAHRCRFGRLMLKDGCLFLGGPLSGEQRQVGFSEFDKLASLSEPFINQHDRNSSIIERAAMLVLYPVTP